MSNFALAQQDSKYLQYMFNTVNINPAYRAARYVFSVSALHGNQWVGFDGAPITNSMSFNAPVD
ncbi:type IX secretion system membrane protein PorP/SprF [Flavobacterium humidisoli]|nr:type IX secretion system membrane protein PorP/SprF [Flavobacterium humidisoli]